MMVALVDSDSLIYKVGFTTEDEPEAIAISRLAYLLEEIIFVDLHCCEDYQVFISGSGNYRKEISSDYKANRKAPRPRHYELLRDYLVKSWDANVSNGNEADDEVCKAAWKYGVDGCVVAHIDKDLDQIPGKHYNYNKKVFYDVDPVTALRNFYKQTLTGDVSDNVIGIKGIGPKKADKILGSLDTEMEMYRACLDAYKGDANRLNINARLLYLQRSDDDAWKEPVDA